VLGPWSACFERHAFASFSAPVVLEVQLGEQHKGYGAAQMNGLLGRGALVVTMSAASMLWQGTRPYSVLLCENALYRSRMQPLPAEWSTVQRAWRASEELPSRECIECAGDL